MRVPYTRLSWLAAPLGAVAACSLQATDLDNSGLSDVWEQRYGQFFLVPAEDPDGDGRTNAEEALAGTNPVVADAMPPRITFTESAANVRVPAQPGKRYRLLRSTDAVNWNPEGSPQIATSSEVVFTAATGENAGFFRVSVEDADSDGDGVPDWDELNLPGFDPTNAQSAVSGQNDSISLQQRLATSPVALKIEPLVAAAYEKEAISGKIRITRAGGLGAVTVRLGRGGNPNAQKGSASSSDYRLLDPDGTVISGDYVLPQNVLAAELRVEPVPDALREVPEMLTLSISPDPAYTLGTKASASVVISDATRDPANDQLFIAFLSPPSGVTSSASGISAVHLRGDNADALVDLSFSGLGSTQSAAHINAPGGADVKGLARGQVEGSTWVIAAAQYLSTDQAVLDALFSGQLTMNVLSGSYPDGEIRGNYVLSNGSSNPPIPPDPPASGNLTGAALERDVSRFLNQATFGASRAEINALVYEIQQTHGGDRIAGYSAWIDSQFALEPTRHLDYVQAADTQEWTLRGTDPVNFVSGNEPGQSNRRRAWWTISMKAADQLRQRVGFALSEIFVVSEYDSDVSARHYGAANYYDMLVAHADGSFRDLLGEVSRSPIMGRYLSSLKNQKAVVDSKTGQVLISPDENYAREVMQLFSIGLVYLNADGSVKLDASGRPKATYTNTDITELARVFTGWSFSKTHGAKAAGYPVQDNTKFSQGNGPAYFQASWLNSMKNFPEYHDTAAKTVLGTAIPAGLNGQQDLDAALNILANHPNVGPFIARRLIQRLVTSNPSAGYVYRVAKVFDNDGGGDRGNLKEVVRAILLDYEARNPAAASQVAHGKQKEPILRYIQLLRGMGAASALPLSDLGAYGYPATQLDNFPSGTTRYRYPNTESNLSQSPLRSPTVFNWFLPDYSPGGAIAAAGLVAPEMQVTTETQVIQSINYARGIIDSNDGQGVTALFGATDASLDNVKLDRTPLVNLYNSAITAGRPAKEAITAVVDEADLILNEGRLKERYETAPTPNPRSLIIDTAVATTENATNNEKVKAILYLIVTSPEYMHQQ